MSNRLDFPKAGPGEERGKILHFSDVIQRSFDRGIAFIGKGGKPVPKERRGLLGQHFAFQPLGKKLFFQISEKRGGFFNH